MDKREKERYSANLPVRFDKGSGIARDISATGIFVETDRHIEVGSRMSLVIDLHTHGGKLCMECEAEVARIQAMDQKHGIGARILSSKLKAID